MKSVKKTVETGSSGVMNPLLVLKWVHNGFMNPLLVLKPNVPSFFLCTCVRLIGIANLSP